jgi:hypothetical protein
MTGVFIRSELHLENCIQKDLICYRSEPCGFGQKSVVKLACKNDFLHETIWREPNHEQKESFAEAVLRMALNSKDTQKDIRGHTNVSLYEISGMIKNNVRRNGNIPTRINSNPATS